jgi:hypothetical protein
VLNVAPDRDVAIERQLVGRVLDRALAALDKAVIVIERREDRHDAELPGIEIVVESPDTMLVACALLMTVIGVVLAKSSALPSA